MTVLYDSPGGVHTLSRLAGGRKALVPSRVTLGQSYRLEVHGAPAGGNFAGLVCGSGCSSGQVQICFGKL